MKKGWVWSLSSRGISNNKQQEAMLQQDITNNTEFKFLLNNRLPYFAFSAMFFIFFFLLEAWSGRP